MYHAHIRCIMSSMLIWLIPPFNSLISIPDSRCRARHHVDLTFLLRFVLMMTLGCLPRPTPNLDCTLAGLPFYTSQGLLSWCLLQSVKLLSSPYATIVVRIPILCYSSQLFHLYHKLLAPVSTSSLKGSGTPIPRSLSHVSDNRLNPKQQLVSTGNEPAIVQAQHFPNPSLRPPCRVSSKPM